MSLSRHGTGRYHFREFQQMDVVLLELHGLTFMLKNEWTISWELWSCSSSDPHSAGQEGAKPVRDFGREAISTCQGRQVLSSRYVCRFALPLQDVRNAYRQIALRIHPDKAA